MYGLEQEFEQKTIETVKNMLNKNLDVNLISEISGLSEKKL